MGRGDDDTFWSLASAFGGPPHEAAADAASREATRCGRRGTNSAAVPRTSGNDRGIAAWIVRPDRSPSRTYGFLARDRRDRHVDTGESDAPFRTRGANCLCATPLPSPDSLLPSSGPEAYPRRSGHRGSLAHALDVPSRCVPFSRRWCVGAAWAPLGSLPMVVGSCLRKAGYGHCVVGRE